MLNSSESHSGLDATAAREIQLVRGPLWGNSYFFWFIPSFCGAFALPGTEFYTEHIVASSWFLAVPKCHCYLMTPTYCACGSFSLLCQPTCPSFLSPGFLWCPSQELPAGQLYNGNAVIPGKVLLRGGAAGTLQNSALQPVYGKQFRLNIGEIVLPHTGNMFECCNTSLKRQSNPCYAERAAWVKSGDGFISCHRVEEEGPLGALSNPSVLRCCGIYEPREVLCALPVP